MRVDRSIGSASDVVVTPIKNPFALKKGNIHQNINKRDEPNTCRTFMKKVFASSRYLFPTGCSLMLVTHMIDERESEETI